MKLSEKAYKLRERYKEKQHLLKIVGALIIKEQRK